MFDLLSTIFVSRWAGGKEDKYFSCIGKNAINVYETDTMTLLDKKSLKVDNVMDFSWSPTDPILSLFVPDARWWSPTYESEYHILLPSH